MNITNFAEILETKSSIPVEEFISVSKRFNNKKRNFLFVNKHLGKHFPIEGSKSLLMFEELYNEIKVKLKDKKVLIVGFAETATGLAQGIMELASSKLDFDPVYYIQTTREHFPNLDFISFEEEHSHATTQKLYLKNNIPEYDTVLFIEDEITTGNTILNFIKEFKKINPNTNYAVASVLNFQTSANEFTDIETFYLVKGELKTKTPKLEGEDIFITEISQENPIRTLIHGLNPRKGLTKDEFSKWLSLAIPQISTKGSTLVLGTEENMYPAIKLASVLKGKSRSTTRSPIAPAARNSDYPIYNVEQISSAYDSTRKNFLYNTNEEFDNIIVLIEDYTNKQFINDIVRIFSSKTTNLKFIKTGNSLVDTSYSYTDVIPLLQDIEGQVEVLDTHERELRNQQGTHYSEMLPLETPPSERYFSIFKKSLDESKFIIARDIAILAEKILKAKEKPVLVSLARAGTPIGILVKYYLEKHYNIEVPHYTVSIIRGKGIDFHAINSILEYYSPEQIQFLDGWVGKGAINRELKSSVDKLGYSNLSSDIAALSDPANVTNLYGTREDYLIPSACLNSIVSGLISRTVKLPNMTDEELHGAVYYKNLEMDDISNVFLSVIQKELDKIESIKYTEVDSIYKGIDEVLEISKEFGIEDINKIKPGVGETTRVLLRRVPDTVLISQNAPEEYVAHLKQLCGEKGIFYKLYPLKVYNSVGIIKSVADL